MATKSNKIYLAPNILVAFTDQLHSKHNQAAAFFRYFAQEQYQLFTDVISLYDAYDVIEKNMGHTVARHFIRTIFASSITIIYPTEAEMKAALKVYLTDHSNQVTFGMTLMMLLADRKNIPQICTLEYISTLFGLSIFYIPI